MFLLGPSEDPGLMLPIIAGAAGESLIVHSLLLTLLLTGGGAALIAVIVIFIIIIIIVVVKKRKCTFIYLKNDVYLDIDFVVDICSC